MPRCKRCGAGEKTSEKGKGRGVGMGRKRCSYDECQGKGKKEQRVQHSSEDLWPNPWESPCQGQGKCPLALFFGSRY